VLFCSSSGNVVIRMDEHDDELDNEDVPGDAAIHVTEGGSA
jgi:hypothetical protein